MSGNPGDIPKFVDDMIRPSIAAEPSADVLQSRPKSEVTRTTDRTPPLCDGRPKSDTHRVTDTTQLSYQTRQKPDEPRVQGPCDSEGRGRSLLGKLGTVQRSRESPPNSGGKPSTGSKDEILEPITISRETQQLVEELKRQYSLPVFVNDRVQVYPDDMTDRSRMSSRMSSTGDGRLQQCEARE